MSDLLAAAYPWLKVVHLLALISWMAGLFYLPRLFVHHVESAPAEANDLFVMMQRKLLKVIMNPAMLVTWATGVALAFAIGAWDQPWFHLKALLVVAMTAFHMACAGWRKELAGERARAEPRTGRFFRIANEVPTVLLIGIVVAVVVKPFGG